MLACDGSVTTVCACARSKRTPPAASRSIHGVDARGLPYEPSASARSVSIVMSRMLRPGSRRDGAAGRRQYQRPATSATATTMTAIRRTALILQHVHKRLQNHGLFVETEQWQP